MNVDISNYMLHDQKVIFKTIKIFQNWHMVNNTQTTVYYLLNLSPLSTNTQFFETIVNPIHYDF